MVNPQVLECLLMVSEQGPVHVYKMYEGTREQLIAQWRIDHPDLALAIVEQIEPPQVPSDRTFRDAWRHCPEHGIRHCMDTARNIQRERMRERRSEVFSKTDVRLRDSLLQSRDATEILGMVAELKDVTKHPDIEAAQTVDELKQVWPEVLEREVPSLGEVRLAGEAPAYDTKALEEWGKSITDRINQAATMRDLQEVLSKLDAKLESANDLAQRLERLEVVVPEIARAADFILKEARGPAELTQEELT